MHDSARAMLTAGLLGEVGETAAGLLKEKGVLRGGRGGGMFTFVRCSFVKGASNDKMFACKYILHVSAFGFQGVAVYPHVCSVAPIVSMWAGLRSSWV